VDVQAHADGGVCELEMTRVRKTGAFPGAHHGDGHHGSLRKVQWICGDHPDINGEEETGARAEGDQGVSERIMESSVDGILTTDLKGRLTYVNRPWRRCSLFQG